ncbi:MAG: SpoIID/LytB domain-containing protein [Bryobacteraceae bacterium]
MISDDLTRRRFFAAAGSFLMPGNDSRGARSFWVLKLLQPSSLTVYPPGTARLHCSSAEDDWIVEGSQAVSIAANSSRIRITGPAGEPVNCMIEIPNVIRRSYFGIFDITNQGGIVIPVVTMDCETATGSIVEAELPISASPSQALAAQAVVSRSIVCAATELRHKFADFCDTTHCQFLRSPALPGSKTSQALNATAGLVLFDRGRILAARYSAACGGATDAILDDDHQYVSVPCEICRKGRIARRGHGWGLCQEGAIGLARLGWTWRNILRKYYPNATIASG